jgi:hypothetical protein
VVEAFFLEAAGTDLDDGLLPVLIAFELDEGPLMDWRPAAVDFLAGEAVVDLVWREEAVFRFFAEAEVSSSATSSESEGLLLSSSFCSCSSSSEVCSRLLRRAGAAFSSAAGHGQRADTHTRHSQPAPAPTIRRVCCHLDAPRRRLGRPRRGLAERLAVAGGRLSCAGGRAGFWGHGAVQSAVMVLVIACKLSMLI